MKEDLERYFAAAHAMQTGVAFTMHHDPDETDLKHLRTGVNSALVSDAALAGLLIAKGIITQDEYDKAIADQMEAEVQRYQAWIKERFGADITLR